MEDAFTFKTRSSPYSSKSTQSTAIKTPSSRKMDSKQLSSALSKTHRQNSLQGQTGEIPLKSTPQVNSSRSMVMSIQAVTGTPLNVKYAAYIVGYENHAAVTRFQIAISCLGQVGESTLSCQVRSICKISPEALASFQRLSIF